MLLSVYTWWLSLLLSLGPQSSTYNRPEPQTPNLQPQYAQAAAEEEDDLYS